MKMPNKKKQAKITEIYQRIKQSQDPDSCADLEEEIKRLEQTLSEKQNELFQLQRNSYRHKTSAPKKKPENFIRPEKIVLFNSVETLKKEIELKSMLTGIEIQSYVVMEHCTVVYHMQHKAPHQIKHGLKIDMKDGVYKVSKTSLPLGFNLPAVLDGFSTVMLPECLIAIQRAMVAYYDRLQQYDRLKVLVNMEAQFFKLLDSSHMEITFTVYNEHDPEEETIEVKLILDYRVYDIRPKRYSFVELEISEKAVDALRDQCSVFKKKPLDKAFYEAFIDGNGAYVLLEQYRTEPEVQQKKQKPKHRPANPNYNNDDTFHPEDCSGSEDDAEDA